ncbi:MAG: molecular chaperone TorD family protein [Bacteroidetes bacterium]|nr:molecular chaperone TorD family protein [Bacteroidota bacterium]
MELLEKEKSASLYRFLAECFYYPDEAQFSLIKELSGELIGLDNKFKLEDIEIDALQIEYSRLFVGPFKVLAPLYGSVYLEEGRKTFGDSTMDVMDIYKEESLKVDLKEPPDHISIELEFMSYLIAKEVECIQCGNVELSSSYFNKQKAFLIRHLAKWIDDFFEKVMSQTENIFYKELVKSVKDKVFNDLENAYSN